MLWTRSSGGEPREAGDDEDKARGVS